MDSRTEKLKSGLADFREMPEARMLIDYRSRESRLSFDDRMAVIRCLEKAFAPVFLEMRVESPSLSESDLIYCALIAAGFKSEVIADCISISKESLRMRKIRVKEKLSPFWAGVLFPESDATKSCDNVAQQNSSADNATILLRQNQLHAKDMETKRITFGQAINSGFRNMFRFTGRASRTEFWYFILFYTLVFYTLGIVVSFLIPFVMLTAKIPITPQAALMTVSIIAFILIIPLISITVRRLHDSERKGAWVLSYLLPMVIVLVFLIYSMFHLSYVERTETETATYSNPVIMSANGMVDIAAGYNLTLSGVVKPMVSNKSLKLDKDAVKERIKLRQKKAAEAAAAAVPVTPAGSAESPKKEAKDE